MQEFKFEITKDEVANFGNQRLDKFLTDKFRLTNPEITRSKIQNLIQDGLIENQDGKKITDNSYKIKLTESLIVKVPDPKPSHLIAKEIDFKIIFEDEDLLVIDKPAGLTVHPGAGNQEDTLVNALLYSHRDNLSKINGNFRPGIIHRLDKNTSGLMLVAKNDLAHQILSNQIKERIVKRSYLAFIYGKIEPAFGKINKNITRSRVNRLKMMISRNGGKTAITNYSTKTIFLDGLVSLVECRLETGRTHQIRVHMASEYHGLIGDKTYCNNKRAMPASINQQTREFIKNFPRQALHSYKIAFLHPRSNQEMEFEIELATDLKELKTHLLAK
jgi:23S rRNA pseudouridine1911/1915/1917 synthase